MSRPPLTAVALTSLLLFAALPPPLPAAASSLQGGRSRAGISMAALLQATAAEGPTPSSTEEAPPSHSEAPPGPPQQGAGPSSPPETGTPADATVGPEGVVDPSWSEDDVMRLASLRDDVRAWLTLQRVLAWYAESQGERTYTSELYRGHDALFSRSTLDFLNRAADRRGLSDKERRALEFLRTYIAVEYINLRASPFDDRLSHAESSARTRLSWRNAPVSYRELGQLAATERSTERRREIERAHERVWSEVLNPLIAEKEALLRTLAVDAGYPSYIALVESYRHIDLRSFISEATAFLDQTEALYRRLLQDQARQVLGKRPDQVTRADLRFLNNPPDVHRFFPPELLLPALEELLDGLGLTWKTSAGTPIRRTAPPEGAMLSPTATAIRVPQDVRLSLGKVEGVAEFANAFHELGHALHWANTRTPVFEFQYLGSEAVSEAFGELLHSVWGDPAWLKRYRKVVAAHNLAQPRKRVPLMSSRDIARVVRYRAFWDLYYLRRVAFAKVVYEAVLHGASPEVLNAALPQPVTDLQDTYRLLFSRAYGLELSHEDALRFRTDVEPFLFSVDEARALLLAHQLQEALRAKHGMDWYGATDTHETLNSLWKDGSRWTAEEVAQILGGSGLSFDVARRRLERLLADAQGLEAEKH